MDRPRGATCATGERSRGGGTRRAPVRERRTRRGDRVGSLLGGCARGRPSDDARLSHDSETLVDMLLSGRLEAALPGAPEEPTVPGPRAFGLRNEARGDVGGVVPSPAPAPWNQPWPKTRVPGARVSTTSRTKNASPDPSPREGRTRDDATSSARRNEHSPTATTATFPTSATTWSSERAPAASSNGSRRPYSRGKAGTLARGRGRGPDRPMCSIDRFDIPACTVRTSPRASRGRRRRVVGAGAESRLRRNRVSRRMRDKAGRRWKTFERFDARSENLCRPVEWRRADVSAGNAQARVAKARRRRRP